jgi:hypothetical protein
MRGTAWTSAAPAERNSCWGPHSPPVPHPPAARCAGQPVCVPWPRRQPCVLLGACLGGRGRRGSCPSHDSSHKKACPPLGGRCRRKPAAEDGDEGEHGCKGCWVSMTCHMMWTTGMNTLHPGLHLPLRAPPPFQPSQQAHTHPPPLSCTCIQTDTHYMRHRDGRVLQC